MVAFLSKPTKCEGFEQIVDFLNAHTIRYALTVNLTKYISCIEQLWSTAKAKTINGEAKIHAKVDGKKIIITESFVRRDLRLADEEDQQLEGVQTNKRKFSAPSHTKKIFANMKRICKGFSGRVTPLFPTIVVQNQAELGKGSAMATDPHQIPIILQPSSSQDQKTQKPRKPKRKNTKPLLLLETMRDTTTQTRFESVSKLSNDSLLSRGNTLQNDEDRMKLNELMELCTNLQTRVLELEKIKISQHNKIASLKRRVKKLEKRNKSRTPKLKRLYKVGLTAKVESSNEEKMFDVDDLGGEEVFVVEQEVVSAAATTKELTLAQALEALRTLKLKLWSTAKAKTINGEVQIHAKVDGKKIMITESSVRRDLRLAYEEEMFDVDDLGGEEVFVAKQEVVSAAATTKELTLAQALKALRTSRLKPKKKDQIKIDEEAVKDYKLNLIRKKDLQERKLKKNKKPILL
nr:hypothetical protein [Tanacetum cinerariifolium]